jgi:uncharacterized membrane protein
VSSLAPPPRPASWLWLAAIAVGPGLALWAVQQPDPEGFLLRNALAGPRSAALGWVLGPAAAVLVAVLLLARARVRAGAARGEALAAVVARGRWLAALPLWPLLWVEPGGVGGGLAPLLVVALGAVAAWSAYVPSSRSLHHHGSWSARLWSSPRAAALVLAAAGVGCLLRLVELGVLRHRSLASRIFDLGIYDNIMWNTMHGRVLGCDFVRGGNHVTAHVDPVLVLLTPLYALAPGAETLIALQAAAVLSGAAPVFLLALRRLERPWLAAVLGLAYLLHPSVHGTILFDVHSLAFAAPLCVWAVYFLETGAMKRYAVTVALLLLCREDVGLLVAGLGLYAGLGRGQRRLGLLTALAGLGYFAVAKLFVQFTPYEYARRYMALLPNGEGGFRDVAATLLANPGYVLTQVLVARKLLFLFVMLAPLLLLPLFAGPLWWTFGYGLAFTLLASNAMNYAPLSHYAVVLFPLLFAAAPAGVARVSALVERLGGDAARASRALGIGVLVASVAASLRLGALVDNGSYRGFPHALVYALDDHARARHAWLVAAASRIPAEASVSASNHVGAQVSARDRVYFYPDVEDADYLIVHRTDLRPKGGEVDIAALERRGYVLIDRFDRDVFVLRRAGE